VSFPRYPAYKDSGVKWLGEVPKEWVIKPIKTLASCNDEVLDENTPPEYEFDYVEISGVDSIEGIKERTTVQFANAPSRARRKVRSGDIIVSTVRTYLRAIAPVVEPTANMIVSTGFAVVRPQAVASSFLGYLFRGEFLISEVIAKSVGVSYPAINASVLMGLKVPVPPPHEQTAIATFLDRETAKIDALVADYRTLIELLQENRQAVISHAVTKGLDPTVPMKDSGVEWLEDVPEHWEVKPLKFIAIGKGGDGIQIGPYGSMLTDIQYDEPSSCKVYGQENVISGDFDRGNRWAPDSTRYSLQGYEVEPNAINLRLSGSACSSGGNPEVSRVSSYAERSGPV
jgi:type I restriction enzyme S subunit